MKRPEGSGNARWCLALVGWTAVAFSAGAAPRLTAETSKIDAMFFSGECAELVLAAEGFEPGEHPLSAALLDHRDRPLGDLGLPTRFTADKTGRWTHRHPLPTDRLGLFKVVVRSGDVALPKVGTRPQGFSTYAVVRDPAGRPEVPPDEAFFGCYGGETVARHLGTRLSWGCFNPSPDRREGLRLREAAETNGSWRITGTINLCHLLLHATWMDAYFTPEGLAWVNEHARKKPRGQGAILSDPAGRKHLKAALVGIMRACREQTPGHWKTRLYDVLSEVDLQIDDIVQVVELAKLAQEAVKEADPEQGVVVLPGVSTIVTRAMAYHERLVEAGLLEHLTCFALHPYTTYPPEQNDFVTNVRTLDRMIRDRLGRGLPMFATESGFSTGGTAEGELEKLCGQLRVQLILLGEGYRQSYAFYHVDYGNDNGADANGDYGFFYNLEFPKTPYGARRISPRAVAPALSAAAWYLDGKRPTACLEGVFSEGTLGYAYADKDDDCVLALWDFSGNETAAELPVGLPRVTVADEMGNERVVDCPGGKLALRLGVVPVYVVAPDKALWGRKGTMAKKLLEESARRVAAREARVKLRIHAVEPAFAGGKTAMRVEVENRTDRARDVTVETRVRGVPEARCGKTVRIEAKGRRSVRIEMPRFRPQPTEVVKVVTTASLRDEYCDEREDGVNFWKAERIVGDFRSWRPEVRQDIGSDFLHAKGTPARDDCSASFAFGWTDGYLVGDVVVRDDVHQNGRHGFSTWAEDAVQMGFARECLARSTKNFQTDMALQAPSEMTFALTSSGPEVYRTSTFNPKLFPAASDDTSFVSREECPFEARREGAETHYRFAVPWKFLNMKEPKAGQTVRTAAFVSDVDPGKDEHKLLRLFDLKQSVPRHFGRIVLGE